MTSYSIAAMERGKNLTSEEQGKIAGSSLTDLSISKISRRLHQSRSGVRNYLKSGAENNKKRHSFSRTPKITLRVRKEILRLADQEGCSSTKIEEKINLELYTSRKRNMLSVEHHYCFEKPITCPSLNDEHRKNCMKWVQLYVQFTDYICKTVVFSDEKMFNFGRSRRFVLLLAQSTRRKTYSNVTPIWRLFSDSSGCFFLVRKK